MVFNFRDRRRKYTIIFDTETSPYYTDLDKAKRKTNFKSIDEIYNFVPNSIEEYEYKGKKRYSALIIKKCRQVVFDIGYTICGITGETIYQKRNFLIKEIFTNMEVMKQAHYFSKYPEYIEMLAEGKIQLKKWIEIKQQLEQDLIDYRITDIWAYNALFDSTALNSTNTILLGVPFDLFITYNVSVNCLWGWACETVLQAKRFIRQAINMGWMSDKGNVKTSAEVCYRYLTQNVDFIEDHTALSDAIIETSIYRNIRKTGKKYTGGVIPQPWRLVEGRAKALGLI